MNTCNKLKNMQIFKNDMKLKIYTIAFKEITKINLKNFVIKYFYK